ncbi:serine-rich adhesin for platelets-like isoform X2 [Macrobrachium rosenbergii]|uniref:serine-rich adhesin for platelets-like isoform X2 n=1 Tax=Macrobrachium rosenbergii TaxID=79674 RepID=UPI0034D58B32
MFLPDTEVDGRCLTRKWQSLKTEVITASLEKTFDAIDQIKENEKEETSRSRPSTLTPNIQSSCSKAENHQFDHVVIVVNTLYRHILQDFQSSRVTVIGAEQLSFSQIPSLIKQHHYEKNKKVLWLLPVGIYSLTEFYQHPSCKRCARPLHVVTLGRSGLPSEEYMMNHNQDMLQKASTLDQVLQEELGPDAFVLFVPPIRAVVVVKEMFKSHTLLHRVCERNSAFCADAEVLIVLREYYNQFCEVWKSLVTGKLSALPSLSVITKYQMENQGQNVVPIADNEDYTYAVEIWKDMLKEFIRESLCAVQIDPESISTQSDKGKNILRKPPNRQSISEFQSGQTVGKNTLPRPRNRQSVSAVQSGQTTGKNTVTKPPAVQSGQTIKENTLPKPPNRQSISEVLSGQTIGKNTLPKPPNKQSSSEVQSGQNIGENTLPKPPNSQSIIAVQSGQTTRENTLPKPPNKQSSGEVQSGQNIGENTLPKPPNSQSIIAVQSGQTTRENTLPKPPNKQSISAVQSGQTIGENTLPKPPNRQSISAVQSGQTTRENTLPKPPNKQSISAVQSGPTTGEISLPKPPNRQSISEAQRDQTIGENTLLKPPNGQSISEVQSDQTIGKNTLPKPPSSQSISEVQSGQTTRENTLPKLPNRQSISEVQSGQTTRENTLPKPPNEQSISEVQGGQTIRENTSPNPPNKQSIIEVQSGQTIGENTLPKPPNRQSIRAVPSGQKVPLVSNTEKNDMFKAFNTMSLKGVETAQISSPALFNTGKEKQNSEGMSSTNVSKIEHIVVIGSKNLCARIESLQNQFPLTFIYENVDFSEECIKRCTAYQKNVPFRTAWIILMDISLLTKKSSLDTPCSNARCRNPFEYDVLKADVNFPFMVQKLRIVSMVNEVLANGVSFAMNLVKELTPGSLVCFAPIAPLHGMIVQPATAHDRIHALKRLGPDVALLQGTYLCWVRCAKYLSKAWKNFMLENTSQCVIHDLLVKYYHNQNVRCIVPVHDDNTVKGNSIQVTRWRNVVTEMIKKIALTGGKKSLSLWRNVVTEMIKKIALTGGEYSHSSLGPFAVHPVNPKQTEAPSEKEVANASARQPQAKATAQAKVQQTAGPVLHPASNVPVASSSEKANRTAKAPQDLAPLRVLSPSTSQVGSCSERVTGTDGPSSAASTTPGGGTGNAVVNMNQSKSGGIVSTQPVTTVSGTSHEHSSCTTAANRGVSSDISHKALGSVSPITAKRKPNEPPIIQPKTSNQALNKDVINTVESTHGTSGMKDSRDVSGKTSSVTERPPLEEKRKNVLKSSSTVQEPHPLDNEKEHSVSLSSLKTCENALGRKQVCETNAVQSSKPNKNIEKIMFCSTIKTSGKSPGRSSNTVSVENEAATCVASQENASVITETCETPPEKPVPNKLTPEKLCNPSETPPEKPVPNKLTPEKLCNPSKLSLSKVSLEKPEVTSNLSPKKLPLEASENVTVSSEKCGAYVVSPNTLGNTGESAIAVESVPLDKGSSKIPSVPEATDKDKDTILSSSNQKAPDGTVASPTDDTSQARPCTGAVQDDSSSIELNQRPNTVVPTYPNGQDLPASIPKDKQSSKRKPRAAVDSVSSDSEPISKASVVRDKVVSGDTNMTSSVSTAVPDASVVDTSVKVSNSKAVKEVQTSSANIVPLAKESCSRASSPKMGGTHNVTSKHVPSSVALVMQSRSGSPSSVNTLAKIPAPTCIVHPTKVDGNVLSSHKGTVAEAHSSPKTNSVTTAIPSGSGKYTLAVKDHGSVPLKMVSLNEGIPTAVVTPKINLQKNCTLAKPSSSKVEESLIVKDPSNQTTYGFVLTNIHRSIKDEDLKVLLGACGPVHSMQRPTNILGKPAEYCCVKFLSHDVALRAKQMFSAVILGGNPLEVKDLGNYAENSSENALQADRLLYHELEKIAMKCKVNLSLKDEMLIQYSTQERLEGDQLPNPSNGSCSNNKEYDNISLSSVSLSSLEDSDHDKSVSGSTGRKIYSKRKAEKNVKGCQKAKAAATASLKATRSSSACRAGGQGLDASSKDVHRPQKRSSFSSKETVNDKIVVKVSNLSDVIPWEIVDRLLMACGALDKGDFEETSGAKVYWFPTYKSALLAEGQLKGLRLLDKILNVKVMCNKSDGEPVLSLDEEMKIRNHALLVLGDYENIMVSVAKTIAESGVNVYSFKTQLCTKESCSSQQLCHDYHSAEDRRRNPLLYNYSSTMCRVVQSNKECNRHEECEDAHSTVEILFHKTKFRSHICIGWSTLRACPMTDKVCPFAHPDCPDLFFHPDWENLYVEGLHNTLLFLSGAILNHFRLQLPGSQKEIDCSDQRSIPHVRILVITPSADMVKLYVQAVKELALTCNMEVAAVTLETVTPDSSVLIGTPASLSKLLAEEKSKTSQKSPSEKVSGTISNIRAIILDDVSSVLKEFSSVSSHQALKRLLSAPGINKVAVSEVISFSEVHKTSRLFSCKLKELPVREQPQSDSIKISKEVYESAALRIPKRTFSPVQDQACLSTLSTPPLGKLLDKSKSGNVTHMPTVAHAQRYDLIDESAPLSPVSDTETVLYSCGGRSPLQSSSPSSSTSASPRKGFESEKSLNLPQEPLLSAKRQRTSHSSRGEVSSSQCRKKLRSSYFSRDHSPSSSSSSRDYPSHYAFPKYNENFLEDGLSQRHKSKPSNRRHKSFHHNSEDELSPLSEHSTRKHSRSNSHKRKSQLPEQSPRRWKASSRHGNHSSDRHTQRHESRSPKRSSRRRKRSSDRSEKYNSKSPEVSPKRKRYHSNEYEERRLHHSSSQDSKKRHKCKKHLSKHFCSSSVRKRETSLSSILLKEELPKDDGKGKNGLEDAATRPSYRVQKPSDTDVQSAPPLKKQSNSKEVGKTNRSTAKEASSAATQLLKPEEGPVLLDKVPSWGEVTKHQFQQNSLVLKNKDVLSRESCKKPEKDIATSSMPSPCETCRIKFDPVTDEEFLKLEKTLKEMHTTDYQVFLDSPEVHPDYDSSYMMFEQYYQQRYGDEGSNEKRESVWNMFWAELVRDQEIEEWTVKREGLLKHFENDRKQNCKCASKVKESLRKKMNTVVIRRMLSLSLKVSPQIPNLFLMHQVHYVLQIHHLWQMIQKVLGIHKHLHQAAWRTVMG